MKLSTKLIAVLLALVIIAAALPCAAATEIGTTYYVDSAAGDDSNSGTTQGSAWKTIAKAASQTYSQGDKILLKAGAYFEGAFIARGNGMAENPITLGAYGDTAALGKPVLTVKGENTLISINNVSGWTVENLDLSAPDGRGIFITASGMIMTDITVRNCDMHDVWFHQTETCRGDLCCVYIAANGKNTRIEHLTLKDITMRDCAYGIHMGGNTIEFSPDTFVSPEVSYSRYLVFDNIDMNNILYDGMAICSVDNLLITNCALIKTSLNTDYYTAPLWMHHANNVTVENCEVAGATNFKDGMTVDFDGWTTNSTYQYVYSHDNIRFMQNCVYDQTTRNENCTVRYCLSVNDNKENNNIGLCNSPCYPDEDNPQYMENFKFYNNTIVNSSEFRFQNLRNSVIANNIFCGDLSMRFLTFNSKSNYAAYDAFTGVFTNNCFYGCGIPLAAENSVYLNPLFTGTDYSDMNSFRLSAASPLIGNGIAAEQDMGLRDLYGNPLTQSHNIGCYEGAGVDDGRSARRSPVQVITDALTRLLGVVWNMFLSVSFMF